MPWKDAGTWTWLITGLYAGFAFFGGVMGYIMRCFDKKESVNPLRVFVEGGAAAFVGIIVMLLCQAMNLSPQWTGVIVGVCGWLGATATIQMLERMVAKKLGVTPSPRNDPNHPPK